MKKLTSVLVLVSVVVTSLMAVGCSSAKMKEDKDAVQSSQAAAVSSPANLGAGSAGRSR